MEIIGLMASEFISTCETISEENNNEEEKLLWEKCVDFFNEHKEKIAVVTFIGGLLYTGYNTYKLQKEFSSMSQATMKDLRELERRIEENKYVLKKMDEENSKINMWFAQTPKLPKPRGVNGSKFRRC